MKRIITLIIALLTLAGCSTPIPHYYDNRPYYAQPQTVIVPVSPYYSPYVPPPPSTYYPYKP
jgi:hypothetical protein